MTTINQKQNMKEDKEFYEVSCAENPDVNYFNTLEEAKAFCDKHDDLDYGLIMLCDKNKKHIGDWGDYEEEEEEKEYTIEIQVVGWGYCRYYDKEDMDKYVVRCKNGVWKMKGDKTVRDMEGDYCETESESEEE